MMQTVILDHGQYKYDESHPLGLKKGGGFGQVFLGQNQNGNEVALKIFHVHKVEDAHRELEFARGRVGAPAQHIIPVLDCGIDEESSRPCIVMSVAEGGSLTDRIKRGAPLSENEVREILTEIARGLVEAGDWIHRDLKPDNVLRFESRWCITDFGIGRIADAKTAANTLKTFGTEEYAAPEQWGGRRASHRTDVYALGCIGVELLTGSPPFKGPNFSAQHQTELPIITAGSALLRTLLLEMLAKAEVARPTAEDVIKRLASMSFPPSGGQGLERLEQISSEVTEEEAKERAKEAAEKARTLERQELDQIGVGRLRSIMEQLFGMIRGVPRVKVKVEGLEGNQTYSAGLKRGRLSVGVAEFRKLSPYEFFEVWDVICGSRIHVSYSTQSGGHNSRGASLWYTDLGEGSGRYRWYEVAYFRTKDIDYVPPTPEALPPGQNAAYAVGGKLGWKLANQPSPIETAEQIERFCQRWLMLFAQACDQESLSQFAEKDLGISLA